MIRCLLAALCVAASLTTASAAEKKNVLFIAVDDMNNDLGCYGHPYVKSPNIDALAASGVRFDRAYCQFPLCNPSRSSMLTGRHPTTTGVLGNRGFFGDAHPDFISLPMFFKTNGYASLRTGKIFHGGIDDTEAWTRGGEARGANAEASIRPLINNDELMFVQYHLPNNRPDREGDAKLTQAQRSDRYLILSG